MKKFTGVLFAMMILFSGCSQPDPENGAADQNNIQEAPTNPSIVVSGTDTAVLSNIGNPGASLPTGTTTSSGSPNPAHGQPGHRCDIPVGSPLNSPPGNTTPVNTSGAIPAPVNITPPAPSTPVLSTPVKTAPGMNPPHGEAGHDCAIPVGSPLKK